MGAQRLSASDEGSLRYNHPMPPGMDVLNAFRHLMKDHAINVVRGVVFLVCSTPFGI